MFADPKSMILEVCSIEGLNIAQVQDSHIQHFYLKMPYVSAREVGRLWNISLKSRNQACFKKLMECMLSLLESEKTFKIQYCNDSDTNLSNVTTKL